MSMTRAKWEVGEDRTGNSLPCKPSSIAQNGQVKQVPGTLHDFTSYSQSLSTRLRKTFAALHGG